MDKVKTVIRDAKGRLAKGSVLNPFGNKHTKNIDDLVNALDDYAKRKKYKNFEQFVSERAFKNDAVLVAVLKKVYPDKQEIGLSKEFLEEELELIPTNGEFNKSRIQPYLNQ